MFLPASPRYDDRAPREAQGEAGKRVQRTPSDKVVPPPWAHGASSQQAFVRGLVVSGTVPGIVLFFTSFGYGTLARELGFGFGHTIFLTVFLYALPAQVILVDQIARGATVYAAGFAVMLTAVRLLPMTVNIVPLLQAEGRSPLWQVLAVHFVAITSWVEGLSRLPQLPATLRLPHYCGIGIGMVAATMAGTTAGFVAAGALPPLLAAMLLFMTPLYFLCSMLMSSARPGDRLAILLGCLLGPPLYLLAPDFDLMLTGLIAGSIAFAIGERTR